MIPTIVEIRDQILADIQTALDIDTPLAPRSVWGVVATALAGALSLVYRFGVWVRRQIFTATADEDALILRAAEYGLTRTPARAWQGNATATGVDGSTLPAGTLYANGDRVYAVVNAVVISGATTILLRSLERGTAQNIDTGEIVELTQPVTGINREATIGATTQTAADVESLEALRSRLAARQSAQPQGGAIPDYVQWATEVPGIAEAYPHSPDPGVVNVYPLTDDPDPANRIPSGALLTEVTDYLNDDQRRVLGPITVQALAFDELLFDVDISGLQPNDPATQASIENAIEAYIYARRPKIYSDDPDPLDVLSAAELTTVATGAGARIATVDLQNAGGASITSYTLERYEIAKLRTLTWI